MRNRPEEGGQTMFGFTVKGDYEGKEVVLWASMISGMEIISVGEIGRAHV